MGLETHSRPQQQNSLLDLSQEVLILKHHNSIWHMSHKKYFFLHNFNSHILKKGTKKPAGMWVFSKNGQLGHSPLKTYGVYKSASLPYKTSMGCLLMSTQRKKKSVNIGKSSHFLRKGLDLFIDAFKRGSNQLFISNATGRVFAEDKQSE